VIHTKVDRFLQMVRVWVERDGGNMDAALAWMYSDKNEPGNQPTDEQMLRAYSPELWMHIEGQQRLDVLRAVRAGLALATSKEK
jgi:predicted NAD/FAD-dependent oxidoreductase